MLPPANHQPTPSRVGFPVGSDVFTGQETAAPSARFRLLRAAFSVPPPSSGLLLPVARRRPPARGFLTPLFAAAALFLFAGCATIPPTPFVPITGDPVVDGNAHLAVAPPQDRVLWEYRVAAAALRRDQFDEARAKLDAAHDATMGALAVSSPEAAKARGTFHAESEKPFIGEPYERIMANYYRAILYWRDGEPDNARALYRDGELTDSDPVKKSYAGDWVLLDYLDGYVTSKLGGDGADSLARARKNSAHPLPDYDRAANVLLFVEYGRGPRKTTGGEYGEQLLFVTTPSLVASARLEVAGQNVALPPLDDLDFQATTRGGRLMDQILGNKADIKKTTDTVGNVALVGAVIAAQSSRTQKQRVVTDPDGRQHVVTTTEKSQGAENTAIALGVVGLLSKLISAAATPTADTRGWDNLPQYLSFAALRLAPGAYPATLTFYDAAGKPLPARTQTFTLTVPVPDLTTVSAANHPRDTVIFRSEVAD